MAYGDTNNTSQSIGGGATVPIPAELERLGVKSQAWDAFYTKGIVPFVQQNHRLPTMAELNSLVTSAR